MDIQEQMERVQKIAGLLAGRTRKVKLMEMVASEDYAKALALVKEAGIKSVRGHYTWQRWQPEFRKVEALLEKAGI